MRAPTRSWRDKKIWREKVGLIDHRIPAKRRMRRCEGGRFPVYETTLFRAAEETRQRDSNQMKCCAYKCPEEDLRAAVKSR